MIKVGSNKGIYPVFGINVLGGFIGFFQPHMSIFFTRALIWVQPKIVVQLSQSIFAQFSHWNILWHNSVFVLFYGSINYEKILRLLIKLTYSFISIDLSCFVNNVNLRFYISKELSFFEKILVLGLSNRGRHKKYL